MQFHNLKTMYEQRPPGVVPRHFKQAEFYDAMIKDLNPSKSHQSAENTVLFYAAICESSWYTEMRPYYKVWPSMSAALQKLSLQVTFDQIEAPEISLCVRFPVGHEPRVSDSLIYSILFNHIKLPTVGESAFGLFMMMRKAVFSHIFLINDKSSISTPSFAPIEDWIGDIWTAENKRSVIHAGLRIAMNAILLARDPSFVEPDVLNRDRDKYEATKDQKYVDRARRRGVVGWNIGRKYESIPHYRRPHLGHRWTEKGRSVLKLVPIKGAVVHRDKMKRVPTGYITPDGTEVEL